MKLRQQNTQVSYHPSGDLGNFSTSKNLAPGARKNFPPKRQHDSAVLGGSWGQGRKGAHVLRGTRRRNPHVMGHLSELRRRIGKSRQQSEVESISSKDA